MNKITRQLVLEAEKSVGLREVGKNGGPEVTEWLRRVSAGPGNPYCCAFAWCKLDDACHALGIANPLKPTASVHRLFDRAKLLGAWTPTPGPGFIFGISHGVNAAGSRIGHCGIVVEIQDRLLTIEANTDPSGSREGDGVWLRYRKESEPTLGYIDPALLFPR